MRITFILIFLVGMLSIPIAANATFVDGYIVKNNNDTVYGLIDVGNNIANSQKCVFMSGKNAEKCEYTPTQIKGYRFTNGKYYVSKKLTINGIESDHFLEFLVQGLVNLYYYEDMDKFRYYVDKGDGVLLELINTPYTIEKEEEFYKHDLKTYYREKREYVAVLLSVFEDSQKTCQEVPTKELDYTSLVRLVEDYHKDKCASNQCIVYTKQLEPNKLRFGVLAGLSYITLSTGKPDDPLTYFRNARLSSASALNPGVGIYLETRFPYLNNSKLFARYEGFVDKEELTGSSIDNSWYVHTTNNFVDKKLNLFNAFKVKYDLNRGKVIYSLNGGFWIKNTLWADYTRVLIRQPSGSTNFTTSSENSKTSEFLNYEVGPLCSFSIKTKLFKTRDISLDLSYLWGKGVINDTHFTSNRISLRLGIQLL